MALPNAPTGAPSQGEKVADKLPLSRRKALAALGLTAGATLLGAAAAPSVRAAAPTRFPASGKSRSTAIKGTAYSVTINNNSKIDNENALVFQELPNQPSDVYSLAWLSEMCHAGTSVEFDWTIDYAFVWGKTGTLKPGVSYKAGQIMPIDDITTQNTVGLSYVQGGYEFGPMTPGADPGSLVVKQDDTVPGPPSTDQGNVGIGMSGAGTFVVPTQPSTGVEFEMTPTYWLAFGRYEAGVVVSTSILTNPFELQYPDGETKATADFDGQNWTVTFGG